IVAIASGAQVATTVTLPPIVATHKQAPCTACRAGTVPAANCTSEKTQSTSVAIALRNTS
ncbi:MAG: hypothetical protein ACKOEO_05800, partial [Planctomycetaceae bacterium]